MNLRSILVAILLTSSFSVVLGKSHLLLVSQGDGGLTAGKDGERVALTRASYLPSNQMISVRPRSGLETLSAGYNYRFGAETKFMLLQDAIELNFGSVLIRSRDIKNTTVIRGSEAEINISGSGTCLLEVGTSGGFKVVGVLGRFRLESKASKVAVELMPGELCFLMPGDRGFGDRVNINLKKLIDSSYLVSGFPNPKSFVTALDNIAKEQQKAIGKSFNAEVGDSKEPDSFEIISTKKIEDGEVVPNKTKVGLEEKENNGYIIPAVDPLTELLGREPRRFGENAINPISKESSEQLNEITPDSVAEDEVVEKDASEDDDDRPFPSRLLRKNRLQD